MPQTPPCYHCGLPVPKGVDYSVTIEDVVRLVCCPGCQAVAKTIVETGLSDYYRYRTAPALTANPIEKPLLDELRLYDRPDIQNEFVSLQENNQAEAVIIIEGITCAACTWLIEHQLNELPGVNNCSVNLSSNRARVNWNSKEVAFSEILERLYQIGYRAHPYQPAQQDAVTQAENRNFIRRLGIAGIGMAQVMMYAIALYAGAFEGMAPEHRNFIRWVSLLIATPVVFYSARPFFISAYRNLKSRHLGMDVPVSVAIAAAYSASIWSTLTEGPDVYFDSVCMFTFFLLLGRFLEFRARHKMDQTSHTLNKLLPASVILLKDDQQQTASVRDLRAGDLILVKAGQAVPADGLIVTGQTSVNESQITGEFIPITKLPNDRVIAGSINVENPIQVEVTEVGTQTRLSGILRMLDQARASKPPIAVIADKVAQYFIAFVLLLAVSVAVSWWLIDPDRAFWITLSVLVVTCPCALSLATPTALTAATSHLLKRGFMITHNHTLEGLAQASHIIFDKTGTLTQGKLVLEHIEPVSQLPKQQCLEIASALEAHSEHPIAQAFTGDTLSASCVTVAPGCGIEGDIEGRRYRIGTPGYALALADREPQGLEQPQKIMSGQWILLGDSEGPLAWFQLSDQLRPGARQAVEQLSAIGLSIELLSGDYSTNVTGIADRLGIEKAFAGASPSDKMEHVRELQANGAKVIMVGDGINDIPVLGTADVSIAMTNASDLAKTTADAVLLSGQLPHLVQAIKCARASRLVIRQNISWALLYNLLALPLAALGHVPPYLAAVGMSASSLLVVLNALRLNSPAAANREAQVN